MEKSLTWDQLRAHLVGRFPDAHADAARVSLVWRSARGDASAHVSLVILASQVADLPSVTLVAMLGREGAMSWRDALLHNGAVLGGALMLRDGVYLIRLSMPLAALSRDAFDKVLASLAIEATQLRARMCPPAPDPTVFSWVV